MARRNIKVPLTTAGINSLITELEKYKQSLNDKNAEFVKRLAEVGIPVIDQRMAHVIGDSDPTHYTFLKVNSFGDYSQAVLTVEGQDLLFIEFGAGIHFNGPGGTSPRPSVNGKINGATYDFKGGQDLKYTIGSYGNHNGLKHSWIYRADTGEWVRSWGTQAAMPVFHASMEILERVQDIAREVFGNG